jgi:RNA polymerase sigma-70 factor, ECF subfamily
MSRPPRNTGARWSGWCAPTKRMRTGAATCSRRFIFALWRSFGRFEGRCSIRTWVYRIAHNAAAAYITTQRRTNSRMLLNLEQLESVPDASDHLGRSEDRVDAERLLKLIRSLKPVDRQLMLLYLEDLDAASIGEIVGISENHVRVQIHRIKKILRDRFHGGAE